MARPKRAPPLAMLAAALVVAQASAAGRNGERWSAPVPDLDSATSEWVPLSAQPRATEPQAFFAPPPPQFQLHQVQFGQPQLTNQHNQFQQQAAQLHSQPQFHTQAQLQQTPSFPPPQINQQSQFQLQPPQLPRQQSNNHHFLHQVGIPQNLQHFILTPPKQDFPVPNIQQVLFAPPPPPLPPQPPQQPSLPSLPPLPRLPQLPQRPVGVQHSPLPPPSPPQPSPVPTPNPALQQEKEEVQLLYVPVETLRQRGRLPQPSIPSPQPPTTPPPPPAPSSTPTPHQPPLSVYMGPGGEDAKISDVLQLLKDARTIPVLDQVGPDAPQVFVGPAGLHPPPGYAKFELPYLSSLDSNRIERKVNRLPFFVAPLSFQPPNGYSKILLPPPHIGSVVVSNSTTSTPTPVFVSTTPLPQPSSTESTVSSGHGVFSLPSQVTPVNPRLPTLVNSLEDTNIQGPPQQVRNGGLQRGRKRPRPQESVQAPSTERVFVQSTSLAPETPSPTQTTSSTPLPPIFSTQEPQDVRLAPTDKSVGPSTERSLRVHQANELHSFIQAAQQEQVDQFRHVTQQPFQQLTSPQSLEQFPQVTTQQPFRQSQGQFFQSTLEPFSQGQFFDFHQRPQEANSFAPPKSNEQIQPQNQFRQHHFVQFPQTQHIFSTPVATSDTRPQFRPKQPVFEQEQSVPPTNQVKQEQNQFSRPQEDFGAIRNQLREPAQREQEEEIPPPQDQFESARNQIRHPHEQGQTQFRHPQDQQQHRFAPPQQVFETHLGPSQEPPQPEEQPGQTRLPSPAPTPDIAPTPDPTPAFVQVRGRIQGVQEVAVLPQVPIELQRPPHHRQRLPVQSHPLVEPSSTTQPTPSSSLPTRRRSRPRPTQNTLAQGVTNDPLAVRFTGKIRNRTRNHQQFIQRQQQQQEQQEEEQRQVGLQPQDQQVSVTSQGVPSETTPIPANIVEDENNFGQRSTMEEQPTTRAIPTRKYNNFVRTVARRPTTTATETPETTTPISGHPRTTAASGRRAPFKANRGRIRARTTTTPSSAIADDAVPTQPMFNRRRLTTEAPETANEVPDSEEQESVPPPRSAVQSTAVRHQAVVQQSVDESDEIPTEKTAQWGDKPQIFNEPAVEIVQSAPIASTTFDWSAHTGSQLSNGWTAERSSPEAVAPIRYDGLGIPSVAGNPVDAPPSDHAVPDADITTAEPPLKEGTKKAVVGKKRGSWVRVRVKRPRGGAGSDTDGLATAESQNSGVASGNSLLPQPLTPSPLAEVETSTTPASPTTPAPTVIPTSSEIPPTSTSYDVEVDTASTPEPFIAEDAVTTDQPNSTLPPSANSPFVGTSTSTKVSMETEICYRGRCIKTQTQSGQT